MGSKRVTKADAILAVREAEIAEIRADLTTAKQRVDTLEMKLAYAGSVLIDLRRQLTPKPRGGNGGPKLSPATAPPARQRSSRARSAQSPPPPTGDAEASVGTASSASDDSKEVVQ